MTVYLLSIMSFDYDGALQCNYHFIFSTREAAQEYITLWAVQENDTLKGVNYIDATREYYQGLYYNYEIETHVVQGE